MSVLRPPRASPRSASSNARANGTLRRAAPFLLAAGLLAWVLWRVDLQQLREALAQGDYWGLLLFTLAFVPLLLLTDCAATKFAYRSTIADIPYRELLLIRAASYLPSMVNHNLGQAWLTYFLSKVYHAPLWRMAGATLFVYATTFACVIIVSGLALPRAAGNVDWLLPTLGTLCVLGGLYFALLWTRPKGLERFAIVAPLFEMGISGHLIHIIYRFPHVLVLFAGTWVPFHFFGVGIPAQTALVVVPVLMLVVALPLTPLGIGTRDAVALQLLGIYLPEANPGAVAAATLSFGGMLTLVEGGLSLGALSAARRLLGRNQVVRPTSG